MSIVSTKNSMSVLIGANPTPISLTLAQITDPTTATTFIADGQVLMVDEQDKVVTGATANISDSPNIRFVVRNGATAATAALNFSARMRGIDILSCLGKNPVASVQQITNIGYDGTNNSIDASGVDYTLTYVGDWDDQMWSEQKKRQAFNYYSTSATQQSIAQSMSAQFNADGYRKTLAGTGPEVSCVMLADGTTQGSANAANIAVVNGSDIMTFSAAQTTTILAVGNIIRTSAAATTTAAVYVITANSGTDSTLSSATGSTPQVRVHTYYQGSSATLTTRGTGWDIITGSANFGLKFTGLALTWIKDFFKYKVVSFHIELKGFGTTVNATPTLPTFGTNVGNLVAEFESFAAGFEGVLNRTVVPLPTGRTAAVSTTNYCSIAIESADRSIVNAVAGQNAMREQTFIFIPTAATQLPIILSQINPYIASIPSSLAAVSLT
jgi:hypothetical protein